MNEISVNLPILFDNKIISLDYTVLKYNYKDKKFMLYSLYIFY